MFDGTCDPVIAGAFLTALKIKGESITELSALVAMMRQKSVKIPAAGDLLDTCGTGGKTISVFNVSTAASFVLAACGVKIAKHGNRSFTGRCGSADVLERLGVPLDLTPSRVAASIRDYGFGFMFAPKHHPVMKNIVPVRKALAMRTIFNFAGPLTNPAGAAYQLLGVCDKKYLDIAVGALRELGTKRALVVWSEDIGDEISLSARTFIAELDSDRISHHVVTNRDFGLDRVELSDIRGGSSKTNAAAVLSVLKGKESAKKDLVLANAAAGLVIMGRAHDFIEGVNTAREAIDSGAALAVLEKVRKK